MLAQRLSTYRVGGVVYMSVSLSTKWQHVPARF